MLDAICHMKNVICCTIYATRYLLYALCYMLYAICYIIDAVCYIVCDVRCMKVYDICYRLAC